MSRFSLDGIGAWLARGRKPAAVPVVLSVLTVVGILIAAGLLADPVICLYGIAALVLLTFVLWLPEVPFYVMIAVLPVWCFWIRLGYGGYKGVKPAFFLAVTASVAWALARLAGRRRAYPGTVCDLWIALFAAWTVLSLLWTCDAVQGLFEVVMLFAGIGALITTASLIRNYRAFRAVVLVLIIVGIAAAVLSLISSQVLIGYQYTIHRFSKYISLENNFWFKSVTIPGGRGQGFATPHATGVFLAPAILLALGLFFRTQSKARKAVLGLCVLLMMAGLVNTLSKGAAGSLLVGLLFLGFLVPALRKWQVIFSWMVLVLLAMMFLAVRISNLQKSAEFTARGLDYSSEETSMGQRLVWWKIGMKELMDTNGLGYGAGGYRVHIDNPEPDGAHAAVLFDLGLVGAVLWVALLGRAFAAFYSALKRCSSQYYALMVAYLAGYVAVLVSWTVSFYYQEIYLYVYLGIGFALKRLCKDQADVLPEEGRLAL